MGRRSQSPVGTQTPEPCPHSEKGKATAERAEFAETSFLPCASVAFSRFSKRALIQFKNINSAVSAFSAVAFPSLLRWLGGRRWRHDDQFRRHVGVERDRPQIRVRRCLVEIDGVA